MAYISSNSNRWYCAREAAYGQISDITAANRIPAVRLNAQHTREKSQRKDKTGSRTWGGAPNGIRRQTTFSLSSYMRDWPDTATLPPHGPLVEAAMGAAGALWQGGTVAAGSSTSTVLFTAAHNLQPGQAISWSGEIRFVAAVPNPTSIVLNAPLSIAPAANQTVGATATYGLATELPSVTLFDYWDPASAVQRAMPGAAVDRMTIEINGDFHQFDFKGYAQDLIDSTSFTAGQGGLQTFPVEPDPSAVDYSPVPGNLGQVWLGVVPTQFFSISQASIEIRNDVNLRSREFGSILPRAIAPGNREVLVTLELFGDDDDAAAALYQAARQQSPLSLMFQLGQVDTQMVGVYLKSLIPDAPVFDDSDRRLKWKFTDARAQGTAEDELVVAFG